MARMVLAGLGKAVKAWRGRAGRDMDGTGEAVKAVVERKGGTGLGPVR